MKKITLFFTVAVAIFITGVIESCNSKRDPGRIYIPDMTYSRAYEAYAPNNLKDEGINYVPYPVPGTLRRGDILPYTLPNDSNGYRMSAQVQNPLPPLDTAQMEEAGRLFNINCAICHGPDLDAQGPLATGGKIPAVANLTLQQYVAMPEGTMFHSVTYGKGFMGSYASQLTRKQRWMIIHYVKSRQTGGDESMADSTKQAAPTTDSAAGK